MIESFYIKALIYSKNYTEFNCIEICDFSFVRKLNELPRKKKKKLETVMWGSEPVVWGSDPLCGVRSQKCEPSHPRNNNPEWILVSEMGLQQS